MAITYLLPTTDFLAPSYLFLSMSRGRKKDLLSNKETDLVSKQSLYPTLICCWFSQYKRNVEALRTYCSIPSGVSLYQHLLLGCCPFLERKKTIVHIVRWQWIEGAIQCPHHLVGSAPRCLGFKRKKKIDIDNEIRYLWLETSCRACRIARLHSITRVLVLVVGDFFFPSIIRLRFPVCLLVTSKKK